MAHLEIDGDIELELIAPGSNMNLDVFSVLHIGKFWSQSIPSQI